MAALERIKERLVLLGVCAAEEAEAFTSLAEEALFRVERMVRPSAPQDDPRLIGLAAACCARQIACCQQGSAPSSFTAGSLKISQPDIAAEYNRLYEEALENASDLLEDNAFHFCTV